MSNINDKGRLCYSFEDKTGNSEPNSDPRIESLVRFIARRAAEEDYKELLRALKQDENLEDTDTIGDILQ